MNFRISDTFTDSLAKLTGQEQRAVKMTAFDLQLHPAQRELVERQFGRPVRIAGSAGTGKTIVALHRAFFWHGSTPRRTSC